MTPPSARLASMGAGIVLVVGISLSPIALAVASTGAERIAPGGSLGAFTGPLGIAFSALAVLGIMCIGMLAMARRAHRV